MIYLSKGGCLCWFGPYVDPPWYLNNNYCSPSFLRSLCEIRLDCFGPRYFPDWGSAAPEEKSLYQGTKTITDNFTQWPKQRWCNVIIIINNRYCWHFCMHLKCIFFFYKNVFKHISHPCDHFDQAKHTFTARLDKHASMQCIDTCFLACLRRNTLPCVSGVTGGGGGVDRGCRGAVCPLERGKKKGKLEKKRRKVVTGKGGNWNILHLL